MGYDSRIYFVRDYGFPEKSIHHSEIVAEIEMWKMGHSDAAMKFREAFTMETPFSIYVEGYDDENEVECLEDVIEDKYGDRLCYAPNSERLYELAKELEKTDKTYWRFKALRKMIGIFKGMEDIYIVHYGH